MEKYEYNVSVGYRTPVRYLNKNKRKRGIDYERGQTRNNHH